MLQRIKELAYDTASKKLISRDPSGKKINVPFPSVSSDWFGAWMDESDEVEVPSTFPQSLFAVIDFVHRDATWANLNTEEGTLFLDPGIYSVYAYFETDGPLQDGPLNDACLIYADDGYWNFQVIDHSSPVKQVVDPGTFSIAPTDAGQLKYEIFGTNPIHVTYAEIFIQKHL